MKHGATFFILLIISLVCSRPVVASGAGHLVMPVQFVVENGDFAMSVVSVKKNGETVLSVEGKRNMRLKLEYGSDYLLSFSKPGYITKMIRVDTKVSKDFSKTGFDPYKIGVCIFKQYEGVNIVVYNQPVAFIRYHAELDEFGYDVDYTKSILSNLTVAETTLAKKAAEERLQITGKPDETQAGSAVSESGNKSSDLSSGKPDPQPAVISGTQKSIGTKPPVEFIDPANSRTIAAAGMDERKKEQQAGEEKIVTQAPAADEALPPPVADSKRMTAPLAKGMEVAGNEETAPGDNTNGIEVPKSDVANDNGMDKGKVILPGTVLSSRTVSEIVEPNRTITIIRISNGEHYSEYRKVNYNWGGVYFFKDNDASISEQLFFLLSAGK